MRLAADSALAQSKGALTAEGWAPPDRPGAAGDGTGSRPAAAASHAEAEAEAAPPSAEPALIFGAGGGVDGAGEGGGEGEGQQGTLKATIVDLYLDESYLLLLDGPAEQMYVEGAPAGALRRQRE